MHKLLVNNVIHFDNFLLPDIGIHLVYLLHWFVGFLKLVLTELILYCLVYDNNTFLLRLHSLPLFAALYILVISSLYQNKCNPFLLVCYSRMAVL